MAFTDDFTGTSGDTLESRTGWTLADGVAGAAQINASNQLKFTSTTDTAYTAPDTGTPDHYAQAEILQPVSTKGYFPVCIRVTDSNNFIGLRLYNGREIYERVGGTFSRIYVTPGDPTPRIYRLEASGEDITYLRDGSSAGVVATTPNNSTATTPGIVARSHIDDPALDNWESTDAAAGGTTYFETITASSVGGVSLSDVLTFSRAVAPTVTATPSLSRVPTLSRTISAACSVVPSLALGVTKTLSMGASVASSLAKKIIKRLSPTASVATSVASAASLKRSFSTSSIVSAVVGKLLILPQMISTATLAVLSLSFAELGNLIPALWRDGVRPLSRGLLRRLTGNVDPPFGGEY